MKRSTITLSIISAILLSACGSSSNSDNNQPVDPTPTPNPAPAPKPAPSPTAPTTPTSAASNPAPEVVNPSSPSSSNSNNNPISPPSIPSISGKPHQYPSTTLTPKQKKDEEAKKKAEEEEAKKKAEEVAKKKAEEEAKKKAEEVAKKKAEEEAKKKAEEEAKKKVTPPTSVDFSQDVAAADKDWKQALHKAAESTNTKKQADISATAANDQANAIKNSIITQAKNVIEFAKALEKAKATNPPKKDDIAKAEANLSAAKNALAKAQGELAAALSARREAEIKAAAATGQENVDKQAAETKEAVIEAIKARQEEPQAVVNLREVKAKQAEILTSVFVAGDIVNLVNAEKIAIEREMVILADAIKANEEVANDPHLTPEYKAAVLAIVKADKARKAQLETEKTKVEEKLLAARGEEAKAKELYNLYNIEVGIAKGKTLYRGVYGTGMEDPNFQTVSEAANVGDKWTLTLKDGNSVEINVPSNAQGIKDSNGSDYGQFYKYNGQKIVVADGSPEHKNAKAIYGYVDNNFFSVGQVFEGKITDRIKYEGTAFVKSAKEKDLVATVAAQFVPETRELAGDFSNFQYYSTALLGKTSKYEDEGLDQKVKFISDVKKGKFTPSAKTEPGNASVYGYFYGNQEVEGSSIGGLVKHDKFHGAFGAKGTSKAD